MSLDEAAEQPLERIDVADAKRLVAAQRRHNDVATAARVAEQTAAMAREHLVTSEHGFRALLDTLAEKYGRSLEGLNISEDGTITPPGLPQ